MKTTSLKSPKNWHFSKGFNLWFLSKNGNFCQLFYSGNIGQQNVFYDILERKKAFLGYKNKKLEKSKNWHFSKGINPWFWSKNGHFSKLFLLGNIAKQNVFHDILEQEKAILRYKKRSSKSRKIDIFPKGLTHGFGPKMAIFPCFWFKKIKIFPTLFFRQYRPAKCLLRYSRTKKGLSRL